MQLDEIISKVSRLPANQQQEVLDFVVFLEKRYGHSSNDHADWSERDFQAMGIDQALRGLKDEEELYSESDLREHWR